MSITDAHRKGTADMTTLDEARRMARRMREPPNVSLDVARVLDWLIAIVEARTEMLKACKTPGAQYSFRITSTSIGVWVQLPREFELDGLLDHILVENGEMRDIKPRYEDMLHDALEAVVANIIEHNKKMPKAVFQYGRWRAPAASRSQAEERGK